MYLTFTRCIFPEGGQAMCADRLPLLLDQCVVPEERPEISNMAEESAVTCWCSAEQAQSEHVIILVADAERKAVSNILGNGKATGTPFFRSPRSRNRQGGEDGRLAPASGKAGLAPAFRFRHSLDRIDTTQIGL